MTIDDTLRRRIAALTAVLEQAPLAEAELPVLLDSLNVDRYVRSRGGMHAKRKKALKRQADGAVACVKVRARQHLARHGGLVVHLVRLGAGELDDDNLAGSFKALRDGFARKLQVDDGDPRLQFVTSQHVDERIAVRVELYRPLDPLPLRRRA